MMFPNLFVVSALLALLANAQQIEIKLCAVLPFGRNFVWSPSITAAYEMFQLALIDAQAANILPMANFTLHKFDSYSGKPSMATDATQSIFQTISAIQSGCVAIVGDLTSAASIQSSLLTAKFNIPQCSFASGSPLLSDKTTYPTFFRTVSVSGSPYMKMAARYGWKQIAFVYSNDALGTALWQDGVLTAKAMGISVLANVAIPPNALMNDPGILTGIQSLVTSGATIMIMLGAEVQLTAFYFTAMQQGLRGPNYFYMIINQISWAAEFANNNITVDQQNLWMQNKLEVVVGASDNDTLYPWTSEYVNKWSQVNFTLFPDVDPHNTTYNNRDASYNCVWALLNGFQALYNNLSSQYNETQFLTQLAAGSFNSHFNPPDLWSTGVNSPQGPLYFHNGDLLEPNEVYSMQKLAQVWYPNGSVVDVSPIYFFGYTTTPPPDHIIVQPIIQQGTNIGWGSSGFLILAVINALLILIAVVFGVIMMIYKDVPAVKHTSPMINIVVLFGLILGFASVFTGVDIPTQQSCAANTWLITLSFAISFSNLLAKAWRVKRIFNNKVMMKLRGISHTHLILISSIVVCLDLVILIVWGMVDPQVPTDLSVDTYHKVTLCASSYSTFPMILFVFNGLILLYAVYLAYKTRNISKEFTDKYIGVAIYNVTMVAVLALLLLYVPAIYLSLQFILRQVLVLIATAGSLVFLYLPLAMNLYRIMTGQELKKGSETNSKVGSSQAKGTIGQGIGTNFEKDENGPANLNSLRVGAVKITLPILFQKDSVYSKVFSSWKEHVLFLHVSSTNAFLSMCPSTQDSNQVIKYVTHDVMKCDLLFQKDDENKAKKLQIGVPIADGILYLQTRNDSEFDFLVSIFAQREKTNELSTNPGGTKKGNKISLKPSNKPS